MVTACAFNGVPSEHSMGTRAMERTSYGEAFNHYRAAVCQAPDELLNIRDLIGVWGKLGHPGIVEGLVEECEMPSLSRAYLRMLGYASSGQPDRALEIIRASKEDETLIGADPWGQAEFLQRAALIALVAGEQGLGRRLIDRAALIAPQRCDIRLISAKAFLLEGELDSALDEVRALRILNPEKDEVSRARILIQAIATAREPALPELVREQLNQYLSLLERGEPGSGLLSEVTDFAERIGHSRAYVVAGMVALRLNLVFEGRRLLLEAAALNPYSVAPHRVLGLSYVARKQAVEAFDPLNKAVNRDPFDPELLISLGGVSVEMGEKIVAASTYRSLVKVEPERSAHFLALARVERSQGEYYRARATVTKGLELKQSIPLVLELAIIETEFFIAQSKATERRMARRQAHQAIDRLAELAPEHPALTSLISALN